MLVSDELDKYSARYMSMIYNLCATRIGEEFNIDQSLLTQPTGKCRFYAALAALRDIFTEKVPFYADDDVDSDETAGRWQLEDVAPRRVHLEFLSFCNDKRKVLKEKGRFEEVLSYREVAREVFDRIGVDFRANENTRINVVDGNFDRMVSYMDEVIDNFAWISWHGNGVRIETRKLKITA